jgi:uncharacterized protein YgbK (DUF1537 family)
MSNDWDDLTVREKVERLRRDLTALTEQLNLAARRRSETFAVVAGRLEQTTVEQLDAQVQIRFRAGSAL